jgi:uncharacterized protein (TIGR00255 family)
MKSMTGYGRASTSGEGFAITAELKTVNNRFLDISLRLSAEMQPIESEIKRLISSRLARGRVDVNLQYERSDDVAYEINRPMIAGYLAALNEIREAFDLAGEPDLNTVVRLPNVLLAKKDGLSEDFAVGVGAAVASALDDLEKMRASEGEMLKSVLSENLFNIETHLGPIEEAAATIADEFLQRLNKRITDMLAKTDAQIEIDQGRMAQEVAYLADRADISEEIARLKTHIEHFRGIMNEEKEVGKRLDFLTQELNREANTITSKTNNMTVKEHALAIKSEIEKIREQVQNVE